MCTNSWRTQEWVYGWKCTAYGIKHPGFTEADNIVDFGDDHLNLYCEFRCMKLV